MNNTVLRMLVASTTTLAFISPSVHAQNGPGSEDDRPVPVCSTSEQVEVDGRIIRRQVTENCEDEVVEHTGLSGGFGIVAGGLLVAGLAAAGGGSGGGGGDDDSIPAPVPVPPPPAPPEEPANPGGGNGGNNPDNPGGGNGGNPPVTPPVVPEPEVPVTPEPEVPDVPDPSDPATWRTKEFNNQYGLGLIGVEHRYAAGATGQGTLGVIDDSGIDLLHSDVGGIRLSLSHSYYGNLSDTGIDEFGSAAGHGTARVSLGSQGPDVTGPAFTALRRTRNS